MTAAMLAFGVIVVVLVYALRLIHVAHHGRGLARPAVGSTTPGISLGGRSREAELARAASGGRRADSSERALPIHLSVNPSPPADHSSYCRCGAHTAATPCYIGRVYDREVADVRELPTARFRDCYPHGYARRCVVEEWRV